MPGHEPNVIDNDSMRLIRHDSLQHVDWRWKLARESVQTRRPDLCDDDPWLVRGRNYVASVTHCRTKKQRRWLVEQFADVHRAAEIHRSNSWPRIFLEARVLSSLDTAEIAQRMGLPEEVVVAFERVFFDCRSGLASTDWIVSRAIGAPKHVADPRPLPQAVRHLSYFGGPWVAECIIAVIQKAAGQANSMEFDESTQDRCRQALALLTQPLSDKTVAKYMKKQARMLVAESRMRMTAEDALTRRSAFMNHEWPHELVALAWSKIEERIRADIPSASFASHPLAA